jgi:O-antigen/teichoic acid export membrane protein
MMRASLRGANLYGLADQALISATSFLTLLVLARALSVSAFGAFALAYTGLLFVNGLQSALVTQPHNVLGAARRDDAYARFTAATLIVALMFLVAMALVLFAVGLAVLQISSDAGELLLAMVPATIAWQLQELTRRILYTEGRLKAAFFNDAVAYGGQALGIVVLWRADVLDGPNALYVIAASSTIGAVIGFGQIRQSFTRTFDRSDLAPHWHFGKWLAAGTVGYGISSNVYFYAAAVLLGASASGELKASQLVLGPLNVVLIFLATVLPIRLSQTLAFAGEAAFWARLRRMLTLTAPVIALYCLLASIFATPLLDLLYGGRYPDAQVLVALFAVYYFLVYLGGLATAALNAKQQTRPSFNAYFVGAASAIILVWPFIEAWGVNGGAIGMIASVALSDLTLLVYLRRQGLGLAATSSPR